MRRFFAILIAASTLLATTPAFAAGFLKELENALKRGEKERASTTLVIHASGEEVKITPDDFESYEIHIDTELKLPLAIEFYNGSGDKKNDIWVNLTQCSYWRMDIQKIDGRWNYEFHFYF